MSSYGLICVITNYSRIIENKSKQIGKKCVGNIPDVINCFQTLLRLQDHIYINLRTFEQCSYYLWKIIVKKPKLIDIPHANRQ